MEECLGTEHLVREVTHDEAFTDVEFKQQLCVLRQKLTGDESEQFLSVDNSPFYGCVLSDLALDWKRGWG